MITVVNMNKFNHTLELYGLSTDQKPIDIIDDRKVVNASTFFEMDTSSMYVFDEENKTWISM